MNESGLWGAIFNLTNSLVGAGCIGYGAAIAQAGGLVSIAAKVLFAVLTKVSFDLLIELSEEGCDSYYGLGERAGGSIGRGAVVLSAGLYGFGTTVAYIKIIEDNLAPSLQHLLGFGWLDAATATCIVSVIVLLPLALLRDVGPLERFSAVKVAIYCGILLIAIYLKFTVEIPESADTFFERWVEVRGGVVESMGTFVFAFVAQNAIHLVYRSLPPSQQGKWPTVTTITLLLSAGIMVALGITVYSTFWEDTSSNMFMLYPPSIVVDLIRLMLSVAMLFTYPIHFMSYRELIVVSIPATASKGTVATEETSLISTNAPTPPWWLQSDDERQLIRYLHIILTVVLWSLTLVLALVAPSLGDILNLVGSASGTMIAYVLPAIFALRLKGYSHKIGVLLVIGGVVGTMGTVLSVIRIVQDV